MTNCNLEDTRNLKILEEMTPNLPTLKTFIDNRQRKPGIREVKINGGVIVLIGLFKNTKIAVCRAICPAGGKLELHIHKINEWFWVTKGKMEITKEGKTKVLRVGDWAFIPKGTPHSAKYLEPVENLAIGMGNDLSDFPEGEI